MFRVDLSGKVAWVTGASRGIGRSIALTLADCGCDVAVGFVANEAMARQVEHSIVAKGRRAMVVRMDVADQASCEAAYAAVTETLGPADILVNNAARTADNLFLMAENKDWESVIATNIMGVVHCTRLVLRDMMAKRWGRVINISSVAGTKGGRGQSNYAATKGAVEAMTRSLACEVGSRGITVNCLAPGVTETDMAAEVIRLAKDKILERQLIKRFATPDEMAPWAAMLASEYAGYMTGQIIHVDGGLKMG